MNGPSGFSGSGTQRTPGRIDMALDIRDHVRDRTPHDNFGGDQLSRGDWANNQLVLVLVSIFTGYFFDSVRKATAETAEPVLMRND